MYSNEFLGLVPAHSLRKSVNCSACLSVQLLLLLLHLHVKFTHCYTGQTRRDNWKYVRESHFCRLQHDHRRRESTRRAAFFVGQQQAQQAMAIERRNCQGLNLGYDDKITDVPSLYYKCTWAISNPIPATAAGCWWYDDATAAIAVAMV